MINTDWMPRSRQGKLDRIEVWLNVLHEDVTASDGSTRKKYVLWKISDEEMAELTALDTKAKNILALAKEKATRTQVVNQQVEDIFNELATLMRNWKRMFFHVPPLTNADMVSLDFTLADTKPTPFGDPTATVAVRTGLGGGYGELFIYIEAVSGDLNERNNQGGFYTCWLVVPAGSPAPTAETYPPLVFSMMNVDFREP